MMSEKEHTQLIGIAPEMLAPGFYFRAFNGKRNFAPPAESSDWFWLESLKLRNGDEIGVAKAWTYPASVEDISSEVAERVIAEIERGMPDGRRFSNHNRAGEREVWPVVQKHCQTKTEAQCRRAVTKWVAQGRLYTKEYHDPIERKKRTGLFARQTAAKQAEDGECAMNKVPLAHSWRASVRHDMECSKVGHHHGALDLRRGGPSSWSIHGAWRGPTPAPCRGKKKTPGSAQRHHRWG